LAEKAPHAEALQINGAARNDHKDQCRYFSQITADFWQAQSDGKRRNNTPDKIQGDKRPVLPIRDGTASQTAYDKQIEAKGTD
jgi:hypothetical protein